MYGLLHSKAIKLDLINFERPDISIVFQRL